MFRTNSNHKAARFLTTAVLGVLFSVSCAFSASLFSSDTVRDPSSLNGSTGSAMLYNTTNDTLTIDSIGVSHSERQGLWDFGFWAGNGCVPSGGFRYSGYLHAQEIFFYGTSADQNYFKINPRDSLNLYYFRAGTCVGAYTTCKGRAAAKTGCVGPLTKPVQKITVDSASLIWVVMRFMSAGIVKDSLVYLGHYDDFAATEVSANVTDLTTIEARPNPFNPSTQLNYNLGQAGPVSLILYNACGEKVASLVNEKQGAGNHSVTFAAGHLPSGLYIARLTAGKSVQTRQVMLMK